MKIFVRALLVIVLIFATLIAVRIYDVQTGPSLGLWHSFVPTELSREALREGDWQAYIKAENDILDEVRREVTEKLPAEDQNPANRYFKDSPIYPGNFAQDWNRSYTLMPMGPQRGSVVLLHGLTDTPYSLRHLGRLYQERGFYVVGIRLPGHGTVPSGLSDVEWEDWLEATKLAVRETKSKSPVGLPLHLVGFSNGGALAMKYALDSLDDKSLTRPDRLILIAPMIGITELSRFAGIFGWPAIFPAFAKAAWLSIVPEFNPFKYNSFPVNGARQSSQLTRDLQAHIAREEALGRLKDLPPVLTFQSIIDFTVSTRAIVNSLYEKLPMNGSELVLFDLNRNVKFGPLLRSASALRAERMLPAAPRNFTSTLITNVDNNSRKVVAKITKAGEINEKIVPLNLEFPLEVFSLSHLALPFPMNDSLYGLRPEGNEEFGVNLGALAIRGERGGLIISLDSLARLSSNPFYDYLRNRVDEEIRKPK